MAATIITNADGLPFGRRAGRALRSGFGCLLVVAGLLLTVPFMLVLTILITTGSLDFDSDTLRTLAWCSVGAVVALFLGLRLFRGKRRMVLYLRKFGFTESTKALTFAITQALGRRWRLVTLDDSRTEPYGVSKSRRLLYGVGRWVLLLLLAFVVVRIAIWFQSDPGSETFGDIFDQTFENSREQGTNAFGAFVGAFFAAFIVTLVILLISMTLILLPAAFLGASTAFTWATSRSVRRAESSKKLSITLPGAIKGQVKAIDRKLRRIFSPKLVVAHVSDAIWQDVIKSFDDVTDYIIIDVSNPTENLLWEIRTIQSQPSNIAVCIGQLDHLHYLRPDASRTELEQTIFILLADQQVLAYSSTSKQAMKTFARALHNLLEMQALGGRYRLR